MRTAPLPKRLDRLRKTEVIDGDDGLRRDRALVIQRIDYRVQRFIHVVEARVGADRPHGAKHLAADEPWKQDGITAPDTGAPQRDRKRLPSVTTECRPGSGEKWLEIGARSGRSSGGKDPVQRGFQGQCQEPAISGQGHAPLCA